MSRNRRPRVCLIRRSLYPHDLLVRREAESLRDEGHEVHVVAVRGIAGPKKEEVVDGIFVHRLSVVRKLNSLPSKILHHAAFFLLAAWKLAALHVRHPFSVIQVNSMPDALVFAAALPKLLGAKVVLFMYEPMPELCASLGGRAWMVRALALIQGLAVRSANAVFTVTDELKQTLLSRGCRSEKVTVVLNVPETRFFRPESFAGPGRRIGGGFTLISHGAVEDRYGHDTMLRAVCVARERIPGLRLRIAGEGSGAVRLEARIRAEGLEENVQYLGWIPLERLAGELAAADAGLVAMTSSPYSNLVHTGKMYEFLAFGKPVLASRLESVRACFGDDALAYFEPEDAEGLAERIVELASNPEMRKSLVANSQKIYRHLEWAVQKEAYLSIFRNLAGRRP